MPCHAAYTLISQEELIRIISVECHTSLRPKGGNSSSTREKRKKNNNVLRLKGGIQVIIVGSRIEFGCGSAAERRIMYNKNFHKTFEILYRLY